MPKIVVTNELAETIRSLRLENKVAAKSLAEHIRKSQSYIAKLEKGNIKTISKDELDEILRFIVSGSHSYLDRVNEILKVATYRYTATEMEEQVWFYNFSTVFCSIPIPEELVDDINAKMKGHNITKEYLCNRINANELLPIGIDKHKLYDSNYPVNEWFEYPVNSKQMIIIMHIEIEDIERVLDKTETSISYTFLLALTRYLFKVIEYNDIVNISEDASTKLYRDAQQYLNAYNYYPISEKYRRILAAEQLSKPDQQNQYEIGKLNEFITLRSELNVQRTNQRLSALNKNIDWNGAFMEKLIALPFSDLGNTSFAFNKKLLDQMMEILSTALNASTEEKEAEEYD